MMNDLVSIVLPVFNGEKTLDETIKSCIEQTYSKIEIIAVNDGSTDNSLEILKSYEDNLSVLSQENKGVSSATNSGIHSMKGKLFKIMNADDVLYPNCVELLVSEFVKQNTKKVVVHGNGETIDGEGNFVRDIIHKNLNHLSKFEQNVVLLHHDTVTHSASLYSAETFEKYGLFNETLLQGVDYEMWLRLCLVHDYKLHLLEEKVVKRRVVEGEGITARALKETSNYQAETRDLVLKQLDESIRNRYEIALKEYSKKYKIEHMKKKPKELVDKLILRMFSPSTAKKISTTYRTLRKK